MRYLVMGVISKTPVVLRIAKYSVSLQYSSSGVVYPFHWCHELTVSSAFMRS